MIANKCLNQDGYGPHQMKSLFKAINDECTKSDKKIPIIIVGEETSVAAPKELKKLFNVNCGAMSYLARRIIGGTAAEHGRWPFVVALQEITSKQFFCGGTLITTKHVLTGTWTYCLVIVFYQKPF